MTVGLLGLGKMGAAVARKLSQSGQTVIGYDVSAPARQAAHAACSEVSETLGTFTVKLAPPRVVWAMVPSDRVDDALREALPQLSGGDVVVDAGNSHYADTQRRASQLAAQGMTLVDVGVSGGPSGGDTGFSLMVGGDPATVRKLEPLLQILVRPAGAWAHLGSTGTGHFAKMVHNGIEYGMMESLAEGVDVLAHGPFPELDLAAVARVWQRGSVIRSSLLDLLVDILETEDLETVIGIAEATGEGAWTVEAAQAHGVEVPAIRAAVDRRKASQQQPLFAAKIVALLRNRFGGHRVQRTDVVQQ